MRDRVRVRVEVRVGARARVRVGVRVMVRARVKGEGSTCARPETAFQMSGSKTYWASKICCSTWAGL